MKKLVSIQLCSVVLIAVSLLCVHAAHAAAPSKTLDNLMKAFDGESNAHARYLAFAKKADEEGYGPVASLFRAASAAEEVHLTQHAAVIKELGGTAKADIKTPDVKSTKENIEAAIKGESYERDVMYPGFVKEAKEEKVGGAVESFGNALAVEAIHAKLYQDALAGLASLKKAEKKDYFICPECGNTVADLSFAKCPICATGKEKFVKVN